MLLVNWPGPSRSRCQPTPAGRWRPRAAESVLPTRKIACCAPPGDGFWSHGFVRVVTRENGKSCIALRPSCCCSAVAATKEPAWPRGSGNVWWHWTTAVRREVVCPQLDGRRGDANVSACSICQSAQLLSDKHI